MDIPILVSPRKWLFSGAPLQRAQGMGLLPHLPMAFTGRRAVRGSRRRLDSAAVLLPKAGIGPKRGKAQSPAAFSRKAGSSVCSGWRGTN